MILGEPICNRVTQEVAERMRDGIASAAGREVFFAGSLNGGGKINEVRVLARGNAEAVPALFAQLNAHEAVLHNHPSGNLEPSDADLELASIYSCHGHGVYIIDNEVTRAYVVVEPFVPSKIVPLNIRDLDRAFRPNGVMARVIPGFEVRPQQVAMMDAIAGAFNTDGIAVIEAPTGVGKTMAYLLPAITWALRNREPVVVSTRTINLQEQIINQDIPILRRGLKEPFAACLVKGRGNYLCLRKLDQSFAEMQLFDDEEKVALLHDIAEWAETTVEGSLSDLSFVPPREIWERVCSESDMCAMTRCSRYRQCFVMKARREMTKANILVVNHHLLFSDLSIKDQAGDSGAGAVLPRYKRLILDEAHSVEDSATEYFGINASHYSVRRLFNRFAREEKGQEKGLLPYLKMKLVRNCTELSVSDYELFAAFLEERFRPALEDARAKIDRAFRRIRACANEHSGQIGREFKWRLTSEVLARPEIRELHQEAMLPAAEAVLTLAQQCESLMEMLRAVLPGPQDKESPVLTEILDLDAYARRLKTVAEAFSECAQETLENNTVRWIEVDSKNEFFTRIVRCFLEVAETLSKSLYARMDTLVMTSATLAVQQRFDYFLQRVGLDLEAAPRVSSLLLDSPFDFGRQALLAVFTDGPDPNSPEYLSYSEQNIGELLKITRGHAFVLFTSFYAMDHAYKRLAPELARIGVDALCQGHAARHQLLERFRRDPSSVLFATDSFWEGVDVPGDALQCVVVQRLPFRVPSEPILEARAEAIEKAGRNAFMEYSVPQAVIKLRQGFGRLIRRSTDWGAVVILDNRIAKKFYGRAFLKSLPAVPVKQGKSDFVFSEVKTLFANRMASWDK